MIKRPKKPTKMYHKDFVSTFFKHVTKTCHNPSHTSHWVLPPNDLITHCPSCPDLCFEWLGRCPGQKETGRRCVHPGSVPLSPHSPQRSSWPPLTDRAHCELGGPATGGRGRERRREQERENQYPVLDQWKDTVYMDCYKIWHEG